MRLSQTCHQRVGACVQHECTRSADLTREGVNLFTWHCGPLLLRACLALLHHVKIKRACLEVVVVGLHTPDNNISVLRSAQHAECESDGQGGGTWRRHSSATRTVPPASAAFAAALQLRPTAAGHWARQRWRGCRMPSEGQEKEEKLDEIPKALTSLPAQQPIRQQ